MELSSLIIDKKLSEQLVDFFAQTWLDQWKDYYSRLTGGKNRISEHILHLFDKGFEETWHLEENINSIQTESKKDFSFPDLEDFFLLAYPNITFLQYKVVCRFVDCEVRRVSDYYSNEKEGCISINIERLFDALKKIKLVDDNDLVDLSYIENYIKEKYNDDFFSSLK